MSSAGGPQGRVDELGRLAHVGPPHPHASGRGEPVDAEQVLADRGGTQVERRAQGAVGPQPGPGEHGAGAVQRRADLQVLHPQRARAPGPAEVELATDAQPVADQRVAVRRGQGAPERLAVPRTWASTSRSWPSQEKAPLPLSRPSMSPPTSIPSASSANPRSDAPDGPDSCAPDSRRYPPITALGSRSVPVVRRPSSSSRLPSTRMRSATRHAAGSTMPAGTTRRPAALRRFVGRVGDGRRARSRAPENTRSPPMRAPGSRTRPRAVNDGPDACRPASMLPPIATPVTSRASPVGEVSWAPARSSVAGDARARAAAARRRRAAAGRSRCPRRRPGRRPARTRPRPAAARPKAAASRRSARR